MAARELGGLTDVDAGAICGLRHAFLHTYGLVNDPPKRMAASRRTLLRHVFRLQVGTAELVVLGDRSNALDEPLATLPRTLIDVGVLGDVVESLVATIRAEPRAGRALPWLTDDAAVFAAQFFFSHEDPIKRG